MKFFAIAVGGALGALGRYGTSSLVMGLSEGFFPWGTFVANGVGAFLIGLLTALFDRLLVPPELRTMALVGFLGSYTTFSTYMLESVRLLQDGEYGPALVNLAGSTILGIILVVLGLYVGRMAVAGLYQGG